MFGFSGIAVIVQIVKIALFFLSLELPAVEGPVGELRNPSATAALHDVALPPSNPRRR